MKNPATDTAIRVNRKPLITALEPRILLDGAALATAAEMTTDVAFQQDAVHQEAPEQSLHFNAAPVAAEPATARREVAFVDTGVDNYQSLVDGLDAGVEVFLLDRAGNGLEQMLAQLQGQSGIDAIHLFSHGDVGELTLGNLTLNETTLDANAPLLATLGQALSEDADLLLYGCYVGADNAGQGFIDRVASLSGADVAASDDLTGAAALGGDWELEASAGDIETDVMAAEGFGGALTAPTVKNLSNLTLDEGDSAVQLDPDISFSGASNLGGGYIEFSLSSYNNGDQFTLSSGGKITVTGSSVYHNGTFIGTIDNTYNGQNGTKLRVNFESNFANPSFEDGVDSWTIGTDRVILGSTVINGHTTPDDTTDPPQSGNDAGGINWMSYQYRWSTDQHTEGSHSLRLYNQGNTADGYDVVHGPYAYSADFMANAGDKLYFDWRAAAGGDAFDAFGYMMKADGSQHVVVLNKTGANDTGETNWATTSVTVPSTGDWYFVFVAGTYDFTGGKAVGGSLYIDNFQVFGDVVDNTILGDLAHRVQYQNTGNDSLVTRNLTVSVADGGSNVGSSSSTLTINQANNPPSFTGSDTLGAFNEDTTSPAQTVAALLNSRFSDPDSVYNPKDTLAGIVITADASTSGQGEWQYSSDGSNWHAVGSVGNTSGLLLSSASTLRFVPAADYNGTPGSLSVYAVDSTFNGSFTNGASRQTFNVTTDNATTSSVSVAATTLGASVTAVNDAPLMSTPASQTYMDSAGLDDFAPKTGSLASTVSDIDSSSFTYGLTGGSGSGATLSRTGNYGTLTLTKATGAYTYTPNDSAINALNDSQVDTFTVTVSDGSLGASSTLTFNLQGANDAPLFGEGGDSAALTETDSGLTTSASVGLVDVDAPDRVTVTPTAVTAVQQTSDGTPMTASSQAPAKAALLAMMSVTPDPVIGAGDNQGSLTWTFNSASEAFNYLKTGEKLVLIYTLTANDAQGGTTEQAVEITINGSNDRPLAADNAGALSEGGGVDNATVDAPASGNVLDNDTDIDDGDTKVVTALRTGAKAETGSARTVGSAAVGQYGTLTLNANGSYSYQVDQSNSAVQALRISDQILTDHFTYTVTDGAGAADQATLAITIDGRNDNPVAVNESKTAIEKGKVANGEAGATITGNMLTERVSDVDGTDNGETKAISAIRRGHESLLQGEADTAGTVDSALVGSYGSLTLNADGSYEYVIDDDNAAVQALRISGQQLKEYFTYTVTDAGGLTDQATLEVVIDGRNDTPVVDGVNIDEKWAFGKDYRNDISRLFSDVDTAAYNEVLTYTVEGLPAGLQYSSETGVISGKPNAIGKFPVTLTGTDVEGEFVTRQFLLEIVAPPKAEAVAAVVDSTPPAPPEVTAEPIVLEPSGLPDGLVNKDAQNQGDSSSGFKVVTDTPAEPVAEITLPSLAEPGVGEAGATETVLLAQDNVLVVRTTGQDGSIALRASVEVSVSTSGEVVFTDTQLQAFDAVAMSVVAITTGTDNRVNIGIADSQAGQGQVYSGTLADGAALPDWVSIDPNTGNVTATPPPGQKTLELRIKSAGADGKMRTLELKLDLDALDPEQPVSEPTPEPAGDGAEQPAPKADTVTRFVPLQEQLETETALRDGYGDRVMALLKSA